MSANFTQVSGPGGRTQVLVPGAGPQTFIWNPSSLKGQLDGGDFIYAKRIKCRTTGTLTNSATALMPNWEVLARQFGSVRVFSQFLGEMVPRNLNTVPILANHDMFFVNGFRPITRKRGQGNRTTGQTAAIEYVFEIPFERDYLMRSTDSIPWLPFLEGGMIEVDLQATGTLAAYSYTATGNWTQTLTIDWYTDKQALIPSPVQSRLYKVTSGGPEYVLKSVGSPNGLDGVMPGSRLALLSWLANCNGVNSSPDAGFYDVLGGGSGAFTFGGGGAITLTRLDIPFRSQVSVDDVPAWVESFLSDVGPLRQVENLTGTGGAQGDMAGFPYLMDPTAIASTFPASQSVLNAGMNFFPMIWPGPGDKISDFQKVNGDLSFTTTEQAPIAPHMNLFRTDEICSFTMAKVYDIMSRMGLPHKDTGGAYTIATKYADPKRADDTTRWGMPLKIIAAK